MAKTLISPGVFSSEIDQSFLPSAVGDIGACVIGPTVKGPALNPTVVTSYSDFQNRFGDSFKSGSNYYQYLTSHTAREYLKHNNQLTVVRILAGTYSHATANISSSVDPGVVGGGTAHTGSLTVVAGLISTASGNGGGTKGGFHASCSITPYGGSKVTFQFTGSTGHTNTSTLVHVLSSSGGTTATSLHRHALNLSHAIGSSSIHSLGVSASAALGVVNITASNAGAYGMPTGSAITTGVTPLTMQGHSVSMGQGSAFYEIVGNRSTHITSKSMAGGKDFNSTAQSIGVMKVPFKLHTLGDGTSVNSNGPFLSNNVLASGSDDNLRYEISKLNNRKGTFTLAIRRGNDTIKRKQTLETFSNINLDPNSTNFIGKAIGDQVQTIRTDENNKPFLELSGSYPNKSKYVRVEIKSTTIDYLDENGAIRDSDLSASLPTFYSGSNSGSFGGSFSGGSDGTVQHPIGLYTYDGISENNSQGLDPSDNGAAGGYNQYIQALDLITNQDEYDVNLILVPGIIGSIHSGVASKVIDVCEERGDCFTILDPVIHGKNVVDATTQVETRNSSYAAMYWPWIKIADLQVAGTQRWVPPSVVMAGIYAFNDKVAHPWFAPAGLNRGGIDSALQSERKLTQSDRDTLYQSNVNPIATFPGQGVCVWGQKTTQKKSSALDRINVRRLLIKVKKFISASSRFLIFEQNTSATRRRFLGIVNPFMENIQSQSGLNAFRVVMDETNNTPDTIDRNQLVGQIFLQPTRTAEFVVLDFTVQSTGASFE